MMNENKKQKSTTFFVIAGILLLLVIGSVIAIIMPRIGKTTKTTTINEIKEKLDIEFKEPSDAKDLEYDIENNSIAKVTYAKQLPGGKTMHFVMRSSYAQEEDLENLGRDVEFSTQPIYMTVICEDDSEVEVESYVALDEDGNMKYMKALWMDNDKYYSMVTDDLVTREDFLQEVNRIIIDNHIPF